MSQHILTVCVEGAEISILAGWDRVCRTFFLDVSKLEPDGEPDEEICLYSSSNVNHGVSIDDMKRELEKLGVNVHESLFEQLEQDCRNNIGNRYAVHAADGSFVDRIPQ